MNTITKKIFFSLCCFVLPVVTNAQNFVPLTPGGGNIGLTTGNGMKDFLNSLFAISVAVAAVLAVIMIAIGGFKYMTSESVFNIGGAKEQITNAIVGLIIVLSAILILSVINPDIVKLNLFS